jgi:hypothetical protein
MKKRTLLAILILTAVAPITPGFAEEPPVAQPEPAEPEKPAKERFVTELSRKYNVPESEIVALREKGLGWGEVGHALAIAQKSGKPLSEVMALRDSGLGWGQISQKYGFKLGEIKKEAKFVERRAMKAAHPPKAHHPPHGPKSRDHGAGNHGHSRGHGKAQ